MIQKPPKLETAYLDLLLAGVLACDGLRLVLHDLLPRHGLALLCTDVTGLLCLRNVDLCPVLRLAALLLADIYADSERLPTSYTMYNNNAKRADIVAEANVSAGGEARRRAIKSDVQLKYSDPGESCSSLMLAL